MFFDDPKNDDRLLGILCSIAKTQRNLLDLCFDWEERLPISNPRMMKKGKLRFTYDTYLEQLEDLKKQAQEYRSREGYRSGIFWWNLPWEQVEEYLIYDLYRKPDSDGWRFQREIKAERQTATTMLFFVEEGHCSQFDKYTEFESGIISQYSLADIDGQLRSYKQRVNQYELTALLSAGDKRVQSIYSDAEYDSMAHYLMSGEHYMLKQHYQEKYEKSLYTKKESTTIHVASQSVHYKAVFALAGFQIDSKGCLQKLDIENYRYCAGDGKLPQNIKTLYAQKDAAIECAAFLANDPTVKSVPAELFGKALEKNSVDYQDALRQAELYTCLAYKLVS